MITGLLCFVFGVAAYAAACEGEWGAVVMGVLVIFSVLMIKSVSVRETKAWNNYHDYWAEGGPDRRR